jgi:flavin reductase (DIM6/NTAB) family NADH-FMN oxidoreductase RutF
MSILFCILIAVIILIVNNPVHTVKKTMFFNDFSALSPRFRATLINSVTGYKSLCLVGTTNGAEQPLYNLTVFNSIFHLGANPPLVGMVVRPDNGEAERHTLWNIEKTGVYTLNHVLADFHALAHQTSAKYAADVSEFEACGFTPTFKVGFTAPFVGESRIQMGMKLREIMPVPLNGTSIIIGEMVSLSIPNDSLDTDGFVDIAKAGSLASIGLDGYAKARFLSRQGHAKVPEPPAEDAIV